MNKELLELYESDADFKEYVDRFCQIHNLDIEDAFEFNLLREYARYIKENKR